MLERIRKFYFGHEPYESLFVSILIGFAFVALFAVAFVLLPYMKTVADIIWLFGFGVFAISFLICFLILEAFRINLSLTGYESALIVCGLALSFIIIHLVLL